MCFRRVPFLTSQAKVTVSATVKPRMYLHFPDLDPNATGKPQMLEIGHCYMPGLVSAQKQQQQQQLANLSGRGGNAGLGSEIVRSLRVRNVSDRKLYLTCTPNLKKQCFVYAEIPPDRSAAAAAALRYDSKALGEDKGTGQDVGWDGADVDGAGVGDWSASAPRPQVADLPLLPQSDITLYIGLRPVLPTEAYTSGLVTFHLAFFVMALVFVFCFSL